MAAAGGWGGGEVTKTVVPIVVVVVVELLLPSASPIEKKADGIWAGGEGGAPLPFITLPLRRRRPFFFFVSQLAERK